mgnify:CR=1 FL=1
MLVQLLILLFTLSTNFGKIKELRLKGSKMRVTLEEFLQLSKEDQAKVTWLNLAIASEEDRCKMRSWENPWIDFDEEYEGERLDRGLL